MAIDKGEAEITAWCVAHLAKALRRPAEKIDPQTKFTRLGVDSAMAVYLVAELEEWLGRELAPELGLRIPHHRNARPSPRGRARLNQIPTVQESPAVLKTGYNSMVELLRARAAEQPDERAYVFLSDRGGEEASLTFSELERRARALAAELVDRGLRGERALLMFPPGLDFIVAFFGCLIAGTIAVPMMPPRRLGARNSSASIVADCTPRIALTSPDTAGDTKRSRGASQGNRARFH